MNFDFNRIKEKLKEISSKQMKFSLNKDSKFNNKYKEDINFFETYNLSKKAVRNKSYIIAATFTVMFIFMAGFTAWSVLNIKLLEYSINSMKETMASSNVQLKYNLSKKLSKEHDLLNSYKGELDKVDEVVSRENTIDSDLIMKITAIIPKGVSFKSMSVNYNSIQIAGVSASRISIADFQHQLKKLYNLYNIQIPAIMNNSSVTNESNQVKNSNKKYYFSINCNLKDVDINENN